MNVQQRKSHPISPESRTKYVIRKLQRLIVHGYFKPKVCVYKNGTYTQLLYLVLT